MLLAGALLSPGLRRHLPPVVIAAGVILVVAVIPAAIYGLGQA